MGCCDPGQAMLHRMRRDYSLSRLWGPGEECDSASPQALNKKGAVSDGPGKGLWSFWVLFPFHVKCR